MFVVLVIYGPVSLLGASIYGGIRMLTLRAKAREIFYPDGTLNPESIWGFGQIIPVVLLSLPLIGFLESLTDRKRA